MFQISLGEKIVTVRLYGKPRFDITGNFDLKVMQNVYEVNFKEFPKIIRMAISKENDYKTIYFKSEETLYYVDIGELINTDILHLKVFEEQIETYIFFHSNY